MGKQGTHGIVVRYHPTPVHTTSNQVGGTSLGATTSPGHLLCSFPPSRMLGIENSPPMRWDPVTPITGNIVRIIWVVFIWESDIEEADFAIGVLIIVGSITLAQLGIIGGHFIASICDHTHVSGFIMFMGRDTYLAVQGLLFHSHPLHLPCPWWMSALEMAHPQLECPWTLLMPDLKWLQSDLGWMAC